MEYLNKILDNDDINNIIETYDNKLLSNLDEINIKKIIKYLKMNNIDYIEDILSRYTDLLILDAKDFIRRFEILKQRYGYKFCDNLCYNLSILESMWEL